MAITVYSATGCVRCNIVKAWLEEKGVSFEEQNIRTDEGDAAFKVFYKANRKSVRRDASGIFFPIFQDGEIIRQDAGSVLSYLIAGDALDAAVTPNNLGHGWTGGLSLAPEIGDKDAFVEVVRRMRQGGLKIFMATNGNNGDVLETLTKEGLIDCLEFDLLGPASVYQAADIDTARVEASMACLGRLPKARVICRIADQAPETVAEAAQWLTQAAGSNKLAFGVALADADSGVNLFRFRTAARRYQVMTDIFKDTDPAKFALAN